MAYLYKCAIIYIINAKGGIKIHDIQIYKMV